MATIDVHYGDTRTLYLGFTYENGAPLNVSGWGVFLAASQSYVGAPLIYVGTTGANAMAVTGLVYMSLTTDDTTHCPGLYNCDLRTVDLTGNVSTYQTDGLNILPTTFT